MEKINRQDHPHPREVADKSKEGNLAKAVWMALDVESSAVRYNTQSFNKNRYNATAKIDDYQQLKDKARQIKESSIENLPELLSTLEQSITKRGGHFYLAKTKTKASEYITEICQQHGAKLAIKAKSITSEEIKLNDFLEAAGIEIAETDLAEFILQVSGEQPSHIVAPAIHRSRERISELFKAHFKTDLPLETGEELTKFARDILRKKFLSADIGISGANVIAADSGTLMLVESEGNIRMATQAPPVHIALAGVEKVVPTINDLVPFLELLAPSATGQALTSYTHFIRPPLSIPSFSFDGRTKKEREFHLVLIDNGRMQMRDDPVFREALYCIRCSACMNSCANFQAVGGHAFGGETYPGGIGGSWEAGTGILEKGSFSALCSGCSRCVTQCPVKIDIPWLNENLRFQLNEKNKPGALSFVYKGLLDSEKDEKNSSLQKQFFANFAKTAKWGSRFAPLSNKIANLKVSALLAEKMFGVDKRRSLPAFYRQTLTKQFSEWQKGKKNSKLKKPISKALFFTDVYTNHSRPNAGMAAIKILSVLGVEIILSDVMAEGRAALSQGMLSTAKNRAIKTVAYLEEYLNGGMEIIVNEPSVLALFKKDYDHFIKNKNLFKSLIENSYDSLEFVMQLILQHKLVLSDYFDLPKIAAHSPIFFHSHCQQRSSNAMQPTLDLLNKLGFKVETSSVECCGMAGSFGYKKEFYDLSIHVGEDLHNQIKTAQNKKDKMMVVASGVSCHDQINDLAGIDAIHPAELIAQFLK